MEKINSVIPDNTNENLPETTISEVLDSLKKLGDDAREALEYLDGIDPEKLPFLEGLKTGVAESRKKTEELFLEEEERLAKRTFELLNTTGEEEIEEFVKNCGLSLEKLGLKFPKSSEAINYDGWSKKTVNLEMIDGSSSSVTAEANVFVSLGMVPNIHTSFDMQLETKPPVKKIGPSNELRIAGHKNIDGKNILDNAVITFMNTGKIYPDKDFLETNPVGGVVLRPDGSLFSVVIVDEKGHSKHVLSIDPGFHDSLKELEGVLGRHGTYVDYIPPVIDIAESFNNVARGHMGGEHLISVVPKNLFKYEGGLIKEGRDSFDPKKIRDLLRYDLDRRVSYCDKLNPGSMLDIEVQSLRTEFEIGLGAIKFLDGDLSNVESFLSWISLAFSNETGGKDVKTTPEDDWHLSKTERDLVKLFNHLKNNFLDKSE